MATLQEFEVLTTRINLEDIREKIAMFIVSQIFDQKGEFHKQLFRCIGIICIGLCMGVGAYMFGLSYCESV